MADDAYTAKTTPSPDDAPIAYEMQTVERMSADDWTAFSNDVYQTVNAGLSQNQDLFQNAEDWLAAYEGETPTINLPWETASNVDIPYIPAKVDTMVSNVAGTVLQPRLVIVTGTDPESTKNAPLVERYLNDQLVEQRGDSTWYNEMVQWEHGGTIYGIATMAAPWRYETHKVKIRQIVNKMDPENPSVPIIDPVTMETETEEQITEVEETVYDDVDLHVVKLKDLLVLPTTAKTITASVATCEAQWWMEADARKMIKAGIWRKDEVEKAFAYSPVGNDEVTQDREGYYDKTAGGQINPGMGQGTQGSKFFKNRGPIKVWLVLTEQYSLNNDDEPELNWVWHHELNQRNLGFMPYEYMVHGPKGPQKPYFDFCPLARFDERIGFSLVGKLMPIRAEINNIVNAGNNLLDLAQNPPREVVSGNIVDDNDEQFGPGYEIEVTAIGTMKFVDMPKPPIEAFQRTAELEKYGDEYCGISPQQTGVQGPGRRTATENKIQAAGGSMRGNLIAMRFRIAIRALMNYVLKMKVQYMKADGAVTIGGEQFPVPREILGLKYRVDIVGASDPADRASRFQEILGLYNLLMKNPMVAQSPAKIYAITRMVLEAANQGDVTELIGTEAEAQQLEDVKKEMMQAQQEMLKKQAQTGQAPPGGGGAPSPNGAPAGGAPALA